MINLEDYLYKKILPILLSWKEKNIYAISFFVYSNESYGFDDYHNLTEFSIGYNTEKDCNYAAQLSEERWNYAFWRGNESIIINPCKPDDEGVNALLKWYEENKIKNTDFEENNIYTVGYYKLLSVVSDVARRLQNEGHIKKQFGKIPIVVHSLEYTWHTEKATENANPDGEAKTFIEYLKLTKQDFDFLDLTQQPFKDNITQDFTDIIKNLPPDAENLIKDYYLDLTANPDSAIIPEFLSEFIEKIKEEFMHQVEEFNEKQD